MNPIVIAASFILLPFINWPVAVILIRASVRNRSVRSLSERAALAFLIAVVTTVYAGLVANSLLGYPAVDDEGTRTAVRLFFFGLGLYPLWWLWSYYTGRFRDGG